MIGGFIVMFVYAVFFLLLLWDEGGEQ